MRGIALPESPAEALHVANLAFRVRETRMPAKRSVSEYPELVSFCTIHLCSLL